MVRFTGLGDAARSHRGTLRHAFRAAKRAGLAIVGYTHFWRTDGADLRGELMASCDDWTGVSEANRRGWRATIVTPAGTKGTIRDKRGKVLAVECPAIAAKRIGRSYTCNDCASSKRGALCDASKPGPNVHFPNHGPTARKATL